MIFGDLETTGLLKPEMNDLRNQPYITEIYFVKLNWNQSTNEFEFVDEIETFVKPPIPISEEITNITGITTSMLANAPTFPMLYDRLCDFFLGERVFVAHNVFFDLGVLRCELMRMEKEFQFPWTCRPQCTVELSMPLENKRLSLAKLHTYFFGQPHEGAHRARHDVEALVSCYYQLIQRGLA